MTDFVFISDTHESHRKLLIPECDILVHSGDITGLGGLEPLRDFSNWIGELKANDTIKEAVVVCGNHDFCFENAKAKKAREIISENAYYLQDSGIKINGIKFWGTPWQPEFGDWAFNLPIGPKLKAIWELIPIDTDILVTHSPPHKILDKCADNREVGCPDLVKRIKVIKPTIHAFGHIHEAAGSVKIDDVLHINASMCDPWNRIVNKPINVRIEWLL